MILLLNIKITYTDKDPNVFSHFNFKTKKKKPNQIKRGSLMMSSVHT